MRQHHIYWHCQLFCKILRQVVKILPSHFTVTCYPYKKVHVITKSDGKILTTCHPFCHPRQNSPATAVWSLALFSCAAFKYGSCNVTDYNHSGASSKGVPGSECRTGPRLVGCRQRVKKKKRTSSKILPSDAHLSTNNNASSIIYYMVL